LIGQIDLLPRLFGKLLVPPAVIQELQQPKTPSGVAAWASKLPPWIEVKAPHTDLHLGVGTGEDETISLAVELGNAAILIGDKKARTVAQSHGLLTIGTIAVLELADEAGLVNFELAISQLQATSFRVEDALLQPVLAKVRARKSA
jgi:predicted nucleic acid-binding protein